MKGLGTNDKQLIRILVSRSEVCIDNNAMLQTNIELMELYYIIKFSGNQFTVSCQIYTGRPTQDIYKYEISLTPNMCKK